MRIKKTAFPRFLSGTILKSYSGRFLTVFYAAFFALAFSFSFVSCSLEIDGKAPGKNSDGQINYDPQKEYEVTLNLNLFGDERLIIRPDFNSTDFTDSIKNGTLKIYDGGTLIKEANLATPNQSISLVLLGGTHDLSAEYIKNSSILLKCEKPSVVIGDSVTEIPMPLAPYQDKSDSGAKGTVKVKLKLPKWESGFAQTYFIKCGIDNIEVESGAIILNAASETEKEFTINNVPAGSHPVNIVISPNSTYSPNILYSESAIVFSNLTSDVWFASGETTAAEKVFTLNEIQPDDPSDLYIYVTGSDGIYGDKTPQEVATAVGAKLAVDFNNLKKAIDFAVTVFPSSADYTINIDGKVTLKQDDATGSASDKSLIEINKINGASRTFNLKGTDAAKSILTKPNGLEARILKVNAGTVNITDLRLDGNRKAFSGNGGGIYIASGAKVELGSGANVSACVANNGGGVYNAGTLVLSGGIIGAITSNELTNPNTGEGNGVYNDGDFTIKGSSYVDLGNEVYLKSDKVINIEGTLSPPSEASGVVTLIKPSSYKRGLQLLSGDLGSDDSVVNKFKISSLFADTDWKISEQTESGVQKGKLSTGYKIYVAGTGHETGVGDGNDTTGDGTKSAPYASIEEAVKQCWNSSKEFTIYVSGELTDAQTIPAAVTSGTNKSGLASSILIEGYTSNAKDYIDRGLSAVPSTGSGSCLTVNTTTPVTIKKLKLTGGYAENGGGIYCNTANAKITLGENALVTGNKAQECGGGVYVAGTGTDADQKVTFDMASAEVSENTAFNNSYGSSDNNYGGGGIYIENGEGSIVNSVISENIVQTSEKGSGGGVLLKKANIVMSGNSVIKGNTVKEADDTLAGFGGGVFLTGSASTSFCMYGNATIGADGEPNEALYGGGVGLFNGSICLGYSTPGTTETLNDGCGVIYNQSGTRGGGIYCTGSSLYLDSGNVSYNKLTTPVSGDYGGGGIFISNSCPALSITGGVISNNYANQGGGICHIQANSTIHMTGGVIKDNTATLQGSGIWTKGNLLFGGDASVESGNDVYLKSGALISVQGNPSKSLVATITPSSYSGTLQVADTSEATKDAISSGKFMVTPNGADNWTISNATGRLVGP
ncbi:hypothetical protein [Treponema sp.]|uniref:hypothetical protein n=1 Tax=Treponema sp. TaxID=166 RepID=UPI00298E79BF|nr:hypothetical protein [Treponema sp.]